MMMPLFFCQKDLEGGYVRAGNPPDGTSLLAVDCMDLQGLVTICSLGCHAVGNVSAHIVARVHDLARAP